MIKNIASLVLHNYTTVNGNVISEHTTERLNEREFVLTCTGAVPSRLAVEVATGDEVQGSRLSRTVNTKSRTTCFDLFRTACWSKTEKVTLVAVSSISRIAALLTLIWQFLFSLHISFPLFLYFCDGFYMIEMNFQSISKPWKKGSVLLSRQTEPNVGQQYLLTSSSSTLYSCHVCALSVSPLKYFHFTVSLATIYAMLCYTSFPLQFRGQLLFYFTFLCSLKKSQTSWIDLIGHKAPC